MHIPFNHKSNIMIYDNEKHYIYSSNYVNLPINNCTILKQDNPRKNIVEDEFFNKILTYCLVI